MPNTATIYIPTNTYVSVRAFTNASFTQQVTITPETGAATTLTGHGEQDTPMPNGTYGFTTPSQSQSNLGYKIVVAVNTWVNNNWQASLVSQGTCSVMYYSLALVVSEDQVDNDWNDAVVQFTWWQPPSTSLAAKSRMDADTLRAAR
jgi:hypothetical protein